jgi:hypothetical protein
MWYDGAGATGGFWRRWRISAARALLEEGARLGVFETYSWYWAKPGFLVYHCGGADTTDWGVGTEEMLVDGGEAIDGGMFSDVDSTIPASILGFFFCRFLVEPGTDCVAQRARTSRFGGARIHLYATSNNSLELVVVRRACYPVANSTDTVSSD